MNGLHTPTSFLLEMRDFRSLSNNLFKCKYEVSRRKVNKGYWYDLYFRKLKIVCVDMLNCIIFNLIQTLSQMRIQENSSKAMPVYYL